MTNRQADLSFMEMQLDELDYVFIETTNRGPFVDDVFFEVVAGNKGWRIPSPQFPIEWLTHLPNVDNEAVIRAQLSVDNAYFLAWAREADLIITPERQTQLTKRAEALLLKLFVIQPQDAKRIVEFLIGQYNLPSRHYHGLRHIAQCLKELDSLDDESLDKNSIELSIWYHDVIYNAGSADNETMSAKKLMEDLGRFESKISLQKVEQMICATKLHSSAADNDTKVLLDIDLSILGKRHQDYQSYRHGVRKEFGKYSRFKFNVGRRKFLNQLLANPIFQTASMKRKYEKSARENIERELQSLEPFSSFSPTALKRLAAGWLPLGKILAQLGVVTAIYATLSFVLEFNFGIPYLLVLTGLFFAVWGLIEVYLRVANRREPYKIQEGTALRTDTFETYLVVPIIFAVCIRIANYSALYSTLIILGLFLALYWIARIITDD